VRAIGWRYWTIATAVMQRLASRSTDALVERRFPFCVICAMRERTLRHRDIIERLPRLRFIASTGRDVLARQRIGEAAVQHG
jgi:hypothetical protein